MYKEAIILRKQCPIEYTLSLISGKWKIIILKELSQGALRYGKIAKQIPGVSAKVLIQQLREMENDGLIERVVFPEVPPRVEYSQSAMGKSIGTIFLEMRRWGLDVASTDKVMCSFCEKCRPYIENSTDV
jgi:DNA-binding HxlR family transcriptional regulator